MAIEGRRRPVVLVVEDDLLIRMSAADMVESADCIAVEAANADEAVSILEARSDISVVFTDIQMPGSMDGLKLAAAVRDRWPLGEGSGDEFKGADWFRHWDEAWLARPKFQLSAVGKDAMA
jgi:CheY-like chemotaxis protein